jgi:hypothetical protein
VGGREEQLLIILNAAFNYVLRINTLISTKTSKNPKWLEMVYDTGAGTTTISRQIALDAGYKIKKTSEYVDGLGGRVKADYTVIPDLILGGVSLGPVYVHVVDFHKELAQKSNAVLGMNVLSWFKITQECFWNDGLERYDRATLSLEPQFDINNKVDIDKFYPLDRGQRFGTAFIMNRG